MSASETDDRFYLYILFTGIGPFNVHFYFPGFPVNVFAFAVSCIQISIGKQC